jgi:hypothetical protein
MYKSILFNMPFSLVKNIRIYFQLYIILNRFVPKRRVQLLLINLRIYYCRGYGRRFITARRT